ncbi:hypothetical protein BO82DRAFT_134782 [Aspergillus uvarum CBS 121591]|uniref:Uncharacterized protein n=1 Tax=Aspergillus uvarum CBS 121591 TaxID=1448315 RepID=A0A319C2K4_9EURO|nr:hypothetical protein BO82DRAFT_134782 [Aspergillus uvarum CBS 121591]PYH79335.1 hypothetical protein BO82DRAFT_134782 [Aspergillus uvarum CBS 121591]
MRAGESVSNLLLLDWFLLALLAWASLGIYDFMHWGGCLCLSFHICLVTALIISQLFKSPIRELRS